MKRQRGIADAGLIGIIVLVALLAMFAWGAWERGSAAIANLNAFKTSVEAAGKVSVANAATLRANRATITAQQESKHAGDILKLSTELGGLRAYIRSAPKAKPVAGRAEICNAQADNDRLSLVLSEHLGRVRQIVSRERDATLGLLKDAQTQTDQLKDWQEWDAAQRAVKIQ